MPTYNLFAAVWKPVSAQTRDLSLVEKTVKITEAMTQAYDYMRVARLRMNAVNPMYLFAAPEYYWVKSGLCTLYSAEEKNTIYTSLRATSVELDTLLMFPGTVNWEVPKALFAGRPSGIQKDRAMTGFNACPVLLGGATLLDYHKKFNDALLDGSSKTTAFGGGPTDGNQSFRSGGLRFGLDICGDINAGQLSQTLPGEQVDVMVLISGTVTHSFLTCDLTKYPVRNGGAFVHSDNTGKAEKNGVWVFDRGQGWHGSHRNEVTLTFSDLDNKPRAIGFSDAVGGVQNDRITLSAITGFGAARDIFASVNEKSANYVNKFTIALPGGTFNQTAVIERAEVDYKVTLKRKLSMGKSFVVKPTRADMQGMQATGRGNVSKIGKLLPGPTDPALDCYSVPINVG